MNELVAGSAIVTGAGSGIGRAIASALAERGAPVGLVDVLPEGVTELAQILKDKGRRVATAQADVSRWEEIDHALSATIRDLGPVGILVNAAGILDGYASADEMSPALWERVISINLTGTFLAAKRVLPDMLAGSDASSTSPRSRAWSARGEGPPTRLPNTAWLVLPVNSPSPMPTAE